MYQSFDNELLALNHFECQKLKVETTLVGVKKIDYRVESLRMREASGADVDQLMKIERLERGFCCGV